MRAALSATDATQGKADLIVSTLPAEGFSFSMQETETGKQVRLDTRPLPSTLWILLDASALCQSQKMDGYLNRLVRALKRQAHPDTQVTLATYTGEGSESLIHRRRVSEIEDIQVPCASRTYSASYDRTLAQLLRETAAQNPSPLAVWVFSAGNIELSKETAKQIIDRNADIEVTLYNEHVEKEVRTTAEASARLLSGQRFRFQVLPKKDIVYFPSFRFDGRFSIPLEWSGRSISTEVRATVGGKELARTSAILKAPPRMGADFYRRYLRRIVAAALLLAIAYGIYRIFRYYRPRHCRQCGLRQPFDWTQCLHCEGATSGVLVGDFRRRSEGFGRAPKKHRTVIPLTPRFEIGSHSRSAIRLPRRGGKRALYAQIVRHPSPSGSSSFELVRKSEVVLRVNGIAVERFRYLRAGDRIQIDDTSMFFFYEEAQK
jgi:hypothetical protein